MPSRVWAWTMTRYVGWSCLYELLIWFDCLSKVLSFFPCSMLQKKQGISLCHERFGYGWWHAMSGGRVLLWILCHVIACKLFFFLSTVQCIRSKAAHFVTELYKSTHYFRWPCLAVYVTQLLVKYSSFFPQYNVSETRLLTLPLSCTSPWKVSVRTMALYVVWPCLAVYVTQLHVKYSSFFPQYDVLETRLLTLPLNCTSPWRVSARTMTHYVGWWCLAVKLTWYKSRRSSRDNINRR